MADAKISALPSATVPLAGTEVLPIVQSSTTDKVTAADLLRQNGQTVTTSNPVLSLAQTWNAGGVTFTGLKFNATNTASAAGSLLLDLQTDGVTRFAVGHAAAAPYILTAAQAGTERFRVASQPSGASVEIYSGGTNSFLGFGTPGSTDTNLFRDAANTLALRNSTNAQTFRVYNTYTDASNYERLAVEWTGNTAYIRTQNTGTGASRSIILSASTAFYFGGGASYQWLVSSSGHLLANTDNTYDIGASGANRPRTGYFGTSLNVGPFPTGLIQVPGVGAYGMSWAFIGGDGVTDAAAKRIRIGATHYTNAEEPFTLIDAIAGSTTSVLNIGGGTGTGNAATEVSVWTAANNTTTSGTQRWAWNSSGHFAPIASATYNIGDTSARVLNVYAANLDVSRSFDGVVGMVAVNGSAGTSARAGIQLTNDGGSSAFVALHGSGTAAGIGFANTLALQAPYSNGIILSAIHASGVISFATGGTSSGNTRWKIDASGHLLGNADNTYDIGASGANRPRNLFVANTVTAGIGYITANNAYFAWTGRSVMRSYGDGTIALTNAAETDFTRLQFGGTTSSFPAIKRSGAAFDFRLADDSGYCSIAAGSLGLSNAMSIYGASAIPAGGSTGAGYKLSSTANFGVFFGSGAPTLSAAKGSLYLRSDGSGATDRFYINTDGGTTWTAGTTVL